jgi:hypothetical protein
MLRPRVWIVCVAMTAGPTAAAPQDQPPRSGPGSVSPDWFHTPRDLLIRGERQWIGRFDPDGNFIPDAVAAPMAAGILIGGPLPMVMANATGVTYEHRSGRLIRGTIVRKPLGVFVPELGSTVLDLKKDFAPKPDLRIYNLQETLGRAPTKRASGEPPKAGQPPGWLLVPFREAYPNAPEKQNPWFARVIGGVMELGHLSDEGEFIPDYGLPVFPYVQVKQPDLLRDGSGRTMYYTLPKDGKESEEVYEYRSGRLIKGTLQKTGNFVPELGSKVLDFKDYDPHGRRRIYNLPGVLKWVGK